MGALEHELAVVDVLAACRVWENVPRIDPLGGRDDFLFDGEIDPVAVGGGGVAGLAPGIAGGCPGVAGAAAGGAAAGAATGAGGVSPFFNGRVSGTPVSLCTTWLSSSLASISSGTGISLKEKDFSSALSRISPNLAAPAST